MASTAFAGHFLRQIELYLTGAGLLVILVVPMFFSAEERLSAIAITAVGVGVVHGLLFWIVRRKQRMVREALLQELRLMLKDRINNKLQVVLASAESPNVDMSADDQQRLQDVAAAVQDVSTLLDRLSLESLSAWQAHYSYEPTRL